MGFGLLDGLVFKPDKRHAVLVTTRTLAARWLAAQQEVWKDSPEHGFPAEIGAALRTENFYTQALSHDAAVTHYADLPVTGGVAMLITHRQDIVPSVPKELIVAVTAASACSFGARQRAPRSRRSRSARRSVTDAERKAKALVKKSQDVDAAEGKSGRRRRRDASLLQRACEVATFLPRAGEAGAGVGRAGEVITSPFDGQTKITRRRSSRARFRRWCRCEAYRREPSHGEKRP